MHEVARLGAVHQPTMAAAGTRYDDVWMLRVLIKDEILSSQQKSVLIWRTSHLISCVRIDARLNARRGSCIDTWEMVADVLCCGGQRGMRLGGNGCLPTGSINC